MNADNLTVAYMAKGATRYLNKFTNAVEVYGEGELDYLQAVVDHADTVDSKFNELCPDGEYSGVFVYEVAEPLGEWITNQLDEHEILPSKEAVANMVAELIQKGIES